MKKYIKIFISSVFVCTLFVICSMTVGASGANFEITAYDIDMTVNDDNSFDIVETLDVHFFEEDTHGIYRDIPTITSDHRRAQVSNAECISHDYEVERDGTNVRIKIGDEDEYVKPNETYTIKYRFENGKDSMTDMDEVYFNLIGTQWECDINNITCTVRMPHDFDTSKINFTCGYEGSTENSAVVYHVDNNEITATCNEQLGDGKALTMAIPLEEGYFSSAVAIDFPSLEDYMLVIVILFVVCMILSFLIWLIKLKNRKIFPTVEFYPPQKATPVDAKYMLNFSITNQSILALIVYWANKGLLEIYPNPHNNKDFTLVKLKNIQSVEHTPYEQRLFIDLFNYGNGNAVNSSQLKDKFYESVNMAKFDIKAFWNDPSAKLKSKSSGWSFVTILLSALFCTVALGIMVYCYSNYVFEAVCLSVMFLFATGFGFWGLSKLGLTWHTNKVLTMVKFVAASVILALLSLIPTASSTYEIGSKSETAIPCMLGIAFMVFAISMGNCAFTCNVRRSENGNMYLEKILGFREFLKKAEKDRIEKLVYDNPSYFYDVLPYAYALDVTDAWMKRFEGIAMEPPSWYHDSTHSTFSTIVFMNNFNRTMRAISSSSAPPASSSAGGGFAGGGGGGGGGGSW